MNRLFSSIVALLLCAVVSAAPFTVPTCPDPTDCTEGLKEAFAMGGTIRLTAALSPWITKPMAIHVPGTVLEIEDGAVLLARRWYFNSTGASLLTVSGTENITLIGVAAPNSSSSTTPRGTLRMWRSDYNNPNWYKHAEWRMALWLGNSCNVIIKNLIFEESGGDGLYLGGSFNKNVTIMDTISRNNYRQGISVITAEALLVYNCVFEGTKGTAPMAGVDFEPDSPQTQITGVIFNQCLFRNNSGFQIQFYLGNYDSTSVPIDVTFMNIMVEDSPNQGGVSLYFNSDAPQGGNIMMQNVSITDTKLSGVMVQRKATYPAVSLKNFLISNTASSRWHHSWSPIYIKDEANNVDMTEFAIVQKMNVPAVSFENGTASGLVQKNIVIANSTVYTPFPRVACKVPQEAVGNGNLVDLTCMKP